MENFIFCAVTATLCQSCIRVHAENSLHAYNLAQICTSNLSTWLLCTKNRYLLPTIATASIW